MTRPPNSIIKKSNNRFTAIQVIGEDGEWRTKIVSQRAVFDDVAKSEFLKSYREYANIGHACNSAGISSQTYLKHLKNDDDFAEACLLAEDTYRSKLLNHHQDLIFNGTTKESYDRNGRIVSRETTYPIRLIELELKRHVHEYREKQHLDVNVTGGVMVAPAEISSISEWEDKFSDKEEMINVTPKEGGEVEEDSEGV